MSADPVKAFQADDLDNGFYKSDTGLSFGLGTPRGNEARLDELLALDPQLILERGAGRIYHCPRSDPACYFVIKGCQEPNIVYYVPYRSLSTPIGIVVEVASWQALVGLGTAFKDKIFFELLPTASQLVVSSADLPRQGVRFWIDVLAHASRMGLCVGALDEAWRVRRCEDKENFEHWRRWTIGFNDGPSEPRIRFFYSHQDLRSRRCFIVENTYDL